jgi:sugar phosphate isomerase/epimerase
MPGLSTAFFARTGIRPGEAVRAAREMGAGYLELEYRMEEWYFNELLPEARRQGIGISSLHNYCPLPDIVKPEDADGDIFRLSSLDDVEWERAVKYSKRTLEFCDRAGATRAVFHLGDTGIDRRKKRYQELADNDLLDTEEARAMIHEHMKLRKKNASTHLDRVLKALERLIPVAERYGVTLGLENRFYRSEIPNLEETRHILETFRGAPLGPWLDWGHACATKLFGGPGLDDYLETFGSGIVGYHIHDIRGRYDHQPPGMGDIDFQKYGKWLRGNEVNIIEIKSKYSDTQCAEGLELIASLEKE